MTIARLGTIAANVKDWSIMVRCAKYRFAEVAVRAVRHVIDVTGHNRIEEFSLRVSVDDVDTTRGTRRSVICNRRVDDRQPRTPINEDASVARRS